MLGTTAFAGKWATVAEALGNDVLHRTPEEKQAGARPGVQKHVPGTPGLAKKAQVHLP